MPIDSPKDFFVDLRMGLMIEAVWNRRPSYLVGFRWSSAVLVGVPRLSSTRHMAFAFLTNST